MGISDSVTQSIFFIAAIILATATVVLTYGAVQSMAGDVQSHAQVVGDRLRSDLRVINDPAHVTTSPLRLYVKNVGSEPLHPALFTVIVDGIARTSLTIDVLESTDDNVLRAAEVAQIDVTGFTIGSGDHVIRVIAATGAEDDFEFNGG